MKRLCLTRVTLLASLTNGKPVALASQIEFEFRNVGFCRGKKAGVPGEKPTEQGREPIIVPARICGSLPESNPSHNGAPHNDTTTSTEMIMTYLYTP